ncbi:MAG: VWA domain-containing protein [Bacteroidetes bacterium]|nr:VWA domain-containing protein [Bacteroidota bacterium]
MKTQIHTYHSYILTLVLFGLSKLALSDGILLPKDENYPADFLRNKVTEVNVTIEGLVVQTVVYQEFVNEWDQAIDAVYNFPLPADARSTQLLYTRNDTTFRAILKVEPQDPNPGTGQGGLAALVNAYIGPNGLKLTLENIAPGAMQSVELSYISLLDYHKGDCTYEYPLSTEEFITYPIDHLEFNFEVEANREITQYNIPTHPDFQILENDSTYLKLRVRKPMAFLATNLVFNFSVENNLRNIDFYSVNSDTMDGHFSLFVRPENYALSTESLTNNIVFLLGNSSSMTGYKLEQSIEAISNSLDQLDPTDFFNIILFNYSVEYWENNLVQASTTNIDNAKIFLQSVIGTGGSRLDLGVQSAMQQFENSDYSNAIIAFTDGKSPIDPVEVGQSNNYETGIFPIGIGDDIDRYRLEMTASYNYGFATYFDEDDNLREGILHVFEKINKPILKNVDLNFNKSDIYSIVPQKYPAIYAGSFFLVAGRYQNAGSTVLNLTGEDYNGTAQYDFPIEFTDSTNKNKFSEKLWAKEMIDALEQEISIYGETDELKDSVISLSLRYEIRCIYTAYFADYETIYVSTDPITEMQASYPKSFVYSNYPNPFHNSTTIRFYIDDIDIGKFKVLRIYNLQGHLIAIIDVSDFSEGWHEISFDGKDISGNEIPSGIYLVQLQIENHIANTKRINKVR